MHTPPTPQLTAFAGTCKVATGPLQTIAHTLKELVTRDPDAQILIFDDVSGSQVDLNLHGSLADVLQRLPRAPAPQQGLPARAPGRPKLGVVAREITLLPRHWEWLATQPGGASVALRKLVELAQRGNKAHDEQRQAREAAYKVMQALAGDAPGFEEASRALFAGKQPAFVACVQAWPADVREHVLQLAQRGWSGSEES